MPSQAELDAQNNASRARQQARRGTEQLAPQRQQPQVQQPYVNPYGSQYGTDSIQDQSYYDDYYDEEEMTEEEWAAYLAGLEASQESQDVPSYYSDYGARMPDGPIEASYPEESQVIPRGGLRTRGTGGKQSPMAAARLGGIAESESEFGFLDAFRMVINPSEEQKAANLAAGARTGGVQVLPSEPVVTNPMETTPEIMGTQGFIDGLSVNGRNSVTPEAITQAGPPQAGEEGFKFAERGSPQDYFLSNTNDGTTALSPEQITRGQEYAKQQGLNFDPTTGFSQSGEAPQVQAPQGLTTAGGQPLAEFLAGGQQLDAQGRMIDPNVGRSAFERESAAREARQAARPDFGKARPDGDTGDGAPTALFKKEAEAAGLSGRAKSEFVSERSRAWTEAREDREIAKASGRAAAENKATELAIKVSTESRKLTEAEKKNGIELSSAAGALNSLKADLDLVREKGEEISTLSQKSLTEGILGKAISKISPTSSAAQLERASGVLTGDAFIKGMQVIKEFGGGLGSVTEVEGLKVERAQGAIFEAGMSGAERRAAVNNYIEVRENAYNRIHSQFVKQYGAEAAATYLGDSGGNVGQSSQTGNRHPDDQDHGAAVDTYYQP